MFHLNFNTLFSIVALINISIALLMIYQTYRLNPNRFLRYYFLFNIAGFFYFLFGFLKNLLVSITFLQLQLLSVYPIVLFLIFSVDFLKRYNVDPIKIFIFAFFLGGSIFPILDLQNYSINEGNPDNPIIIKSQIIQIWGLIFIILYVSLIVYYMMSILKQSDNHIKKNITKIFAIGVIYSIILVISFILTYFYPELELTPIFSSFGYIIINYIFYKNPSLNHQLVFLFENAKAKKAKEILPICAFCKQIRNENGDWLIIEEYFNTKTKFTFSHGICPACYDKNYSDLE
ncbi:hypothetical protein [Candidatus Lokiarchaeum ossiferum]|uniref:hypothetical protein n=1 Tax=Candidatus Lokiarchaeum ossiferum TaxID=2951803 RepID=UPI00352ED8FA